ncbi:hypothetical protein JXO59_12065, partial [candidate division KSB1 bacterium]|nr:hypothetical protein [candidate division KSB1 bacterium]
MAVNRQNLPGEHRRTTECHEEDALWAHLRRRYPRGVFIYIVKTIIVALCLAVHCGRAPEGRTVYWQAHRGGGAQDAPDNTMAAFLYAWSLGGIPEADLRTTRDSVIICLHDATLGRTTDAAAEIASLPV